MPLTATQGRPAHPPVWSGEVCPRSPALDEDAVSPAAWAGLLAAMTAELAPPGAAEPHEPAAPTEPQAGEPVWPLAHLLAMQTPGRVWSTPDPQVTPSVRSGTAAMVAPPRVLPAAGERPTAPLTTSAPAMAEPASGSASTASRAGDPLLMPSTERGRLEPVRAGMTNSPAAGQAARFPPAPDLLAALAVLARPEQLPKGLPASQGSELPRPDVAAGLPAALSAGRPAHEWAPLKLEAGRHDDWGEQLLATLRERVQMQASQQIKQAHIRLDPPELGRIELTIKLDGERLSVHLSTSHAQLREALQQSSDRLRQVLMPHHAGGVEVDVGPGGRQRQPAADEWPEVGIRSARQASLATEAEAEDRLVSDWLNALV